MGWGEKESPAVNPKHFTELRSPRTGAIVQFDWLLARQSKYDIRNLSLHNPTPEHNKIKVGWPSRKSVRSGLRIFWQAINV